nr:putative tRNA (guanine(26)-N(2))-dimethyltransferase 2 [Ipomoea trifida]
MVKAIFVLFAFFCIVQLCIIPSLAAAIGYFCCCGDATLVQFIPSFDPGHHDIGQLVEVVVHLRELGLHLFGEFKVAFLDSGAVLWESDRLEERDQFLLPVNALVFLLEVHERIACFVVPDVGQARLHSQSQVVANHLHE